MILEKFISLVIIYIFMVDHLFHKKSNYLIQKLRTHDDSYNILSQKRNHINVLYFEKIITF